jgi:ribosome-associated translation inhibitor RaiA
MRLDIQGTAMPGLPSVRRHAEQRAFFELARYGDCIEAVRVRVTERPATSEPRYRCGIAVTVSHDNGTSGHVLARAEGDDVFRLIDAVLARATSLVGGEIERALAAREAREQWIALATASNGRGS